MGFAKLDTTYLFGQKALDLALLQRLDESSLRREVDELRIRVPEVELEKQVVCARLSASAKRTFERENAPKLDMPSSGCPGLYLLFRFLRFLCRSLLIVAENTKVRMSSRGGRVSTLECLVVAEAKSSS